MSSSDSTVTYISISSEDVPFWGICFFDIEQPYSPEAAPQSPIQTPPVPQDEDEQDEHILSDEEQPSPPIVSPTAESQEYVAESDPEEDPEEYEDDETEDGPVDYPMDGGDDGDDDDGELSGDDADDEDDDEEDEEEEEHFALANSTIVIPTDELVSLPEGTKPVIPPPSTDTTTIRARITVRLQAAISLPPEAEAERLLAMPTPPPSLLASLSPPSTSERLARLASTQVLIDVIIVPLPSPPLPPPLYIPPPVDRRDDIPETEMPPRKRLCLSTLGSRYEIRESSTARPTGGRGIDYGFVSTLDAEARRRGIREVGYGIRDTWVDPAETVPEITPMTMGNFNTRDSRTRISQRVAMDSQRVDLLMEDRLAYQETILIVEEEAYAAREDWAYSIGLSQAVHSELQTHREQMQQAEIVELQETDRRRQAQIVETLRVMGDIRRETGDIQAELLALREQPRRARQLGEDARVPDHQDAPRDTDSHI
nr:hypothetical protein [Tanacetum cinerariifolium]